MHNFQNVTKPQWVNRSIGKVHVCANITDTHRRQYYWIYNEYFHLKFKHVIVNKSHISFKGFIINKSWRLFFLKQIVQCQVMGFCRSLVSPTPRAPCAHAERHFRVVGSRASESELLLYCPTPSHRAAVKCGQSKCTDSYLLFNVYMVFSSTKVANMDHYCLSVFDLIRQIVIRTVQQWRIIGASYRFWTDISNSNSFAGTICHLILQMNILLTKETSYAPNWATYNAYDLNIRGSIICTI